MMDKRIEEQLTAYALGETDELNVDEIKALIASDEDAQRLVGEIQALGELSAEAFAGEALDDARRAAILAHASAGESSRRSSGFTAPVNWKRWGALAAALVATTAGLVALNPRSAESPASTQMGQLETADEIPLRLTYAGESDSVAPTDFRVVEPGKPDSVQLLAEGEKRLQDGDIGAAMELYEEVLVNDPSNKDATRKLAEATLRAYSDEVGDLGRDLTAKAETVQASAAGNNSPPPGADPKGLVPPRPSIPNDSSNDLIELDSLGVGTVAEPNGADASMDGKVPVIRGRFSGLEQRKPSNVVAGQSVQFDLNGDGTIEAVPFYDLSDLDADDYSYPTSGGFGGGGLGGGGGGFDVPGNGGFDPAHVAANSPNGLPELNGRQIYINGAWVNPDVLLSLPDEVQTARVDLFTVLTPQQQQTPTQHNTEAYDRVVDNPFKRAIDEPLSTFSIDVDTGSYANVRRFLQNGQLPPKDAVRIEELLNYFNYEYAPPANADPFAAHVELVACPWNDEHRLMRIGLKGREVEVSTRSAANLVFLLDVSGSMSDQNKLPLVRDAMQLLTQQLRPDDRVAIVTYAGNSGLVLPSTLGTEQETILSAIARLESGGSTNGAAGIELAYQVAQEHFFNDGVNRVILATDGDFNVGVTDRGSLDRLIEEKAKSGVFLTVLGVGEGNLKDATMEQLADKGNGQYAYLDSEREARKVLVEQIGGTLVTIAKDVKIQIDFNPLAVGEYRLIGYENRVLAAQDFDDDTKDAGEIGAGHAVTALYEIAAANATDYPQSSGTQSRYVSRVPAGADTTTLADGTVVPQLLTVKLRYKQPDGDTSRLLEIPITAEAKPMADASRDTRFAASVAAFGMALRESPYRGTVNWDLIANLAEDGLGDDPQGYRKEFMTLIQTARGLKPGIELALSQPAAASPDQIELVAIRPFSGGTWVAEIRVPGEGPKRFGVGEGFGSFKVVSIDPAAQCVVVYSEEHRREFTLNVAN